MPNVLGDHSRERTGSVEQSEYLDSAAAAPAKSMKKPRGLSGAIETYLGSSIAMICIRSLDAPHRGPGGLTR